MDERTFHDLRNPLTVIKRQTPMMQRRIRKGAAPDNAQMLVSLDAIEQVVAKLNTAIDVLASNKQEEVHPTA